LLPARLPSPRRRFQALTIVSRLYAATPGMVILMEENTFLCSDSLMMARANRQPPQKRSATKATSQKDVRQPFGRRTTAYRTIWRWHFYAGLFCLPFVAILSISGAVYLFKPQIDAFLDRPYDHLALSSDPKRLDEQVAAALKARPDARLTALELRNAPSDATRVRLMTRDGVALRALVRPDTLEIMAMETEKSRFSTIMHDIHGELLLGEPGAIVMELAGAWAIVMILTGLYLWWPSGRIGFAGVFYPRLGASGRSLLKDLHSVTGFWLSLFALFFLISALPWAKVWGSSFKYLRSIGAEREVRQDWTTGPASAQTQRQEMFNAARPGQSEAEDEHAAHRAHQNGDAAPQMVSPYPTGFDKIAVRVFPLSLPEPVLIAPPSPAAPNWVVRSDTQNRPKRVTLEFDPKTFNLVKEISFGDRPLIDRVIGVGVAAHEGQLFGWFNQLLGLMTALGYLVLVVTSTLMWWRRRPIGVLGAPPEILPRRRLAAGLIGLIAVIGVLLPTLGLSLLATLGVEALIRRRFPATGRWLGLEPIRVTAAPRRA
jgi:uncharacterized iron-regulated membrane protein